MVRIAVLIALAAAASEDSAASKMFDNLSDQADSKIDATRDQAHQVISNVQQKVGKLETELAQQASLTVGPQIKEVQDKAKKMQAELDNLLAFLKDENQIENKMQDYFMSPAKDAGKKVENKLKEMVDNGLQAMMNSLNSIANTELIMDQNVVQDKLHSKIQAGMEGVQQALGEALALYGSDLRAGLATTASLADQQEQLVKDFAGEMQDIPNNLKQQADKMVVDAAKAAHGMVDESANGAHAGVEQVETQAKTQVKVAGLVQETEYVDMFQI